MAEHAQGQRPAIRTTATTTGITFRADRPARRPQNGQAFLRPAAGQARVKANGHAAHDSQAKEVPNPPSPPAIYVAIVQAIEKRRVQLALTLVDLDCLVQWSEGFSSKALYPGTSHGRGMSWQTLERLCAVLWPHGVSVSFRPRGDEPLTIRGALATEPQGLRSYLRHRLARLAAAGGRASMAARTPAERSAFSRRAALIGAEKRRKQLAADRAAITAKLEQPEPRPRLGIGSVPVTLRRPSPASARQAASRE